MLVERDLKFVVMWRNACDVHQKASGLIHSPSCSGSGLTLHLTLKLLHIINCRMTNKASYVFKKRACWNYKLNKNKKNVICLCNLKIFMSDVIVDIFFTFPIMYTNNTPNNNKVLPWYFASLTCYFSFPHFHLFLSLIHYHCFSSWSSSCKFFGSFACRSISYLQTSKWETWGSMLMLEHICCITTSLYPLYFIPSHIIL